ncbi:MAG: TauD/TfdA family dioxygenase [Alphaproteobacteria bacterium]
MSHPLSVLDMMPETFSGPSAWLGPDMARQPDRWLAILSPDMVRELEGAASQFLSRDRDIGTITRDDFPLPRFANKLAQLKQDLLHGVGVRVFRGLPIGRYDLRTTATIFCGIGAHLGRARSQNAAGHILGHVRDIGAKGTDANTRIYQTSERQTFHTDSADVVALLCLQAAREGGRSLLVSVQSIYNRMRTERPDLLALLFEPIATDRRGEVPEGAAPFMTIPVLNWHAGHLTVFYQRQYIESAQRFADATRLTEKHIAALDMFDALANHEDLHFAMDLQPGDMQFVYNHGQLHDRTGFVDWPEPENRRHLLRLWLSVAGDRPLPDCFRQRYGSIEIGNRGGIITARTTTLHAPLEG